MDHLTSRFRRNKRESPTTPTAHDPWPASPAAAAAATAAATASTDRKSTLPTLSITTTPLATTTMTTTPPSSSNGSHSLLPKSPLRTFNHFRTARKRARSPAPPQNGIPSIMSTLSPVEPPTGGAPTDGPVTPPETSQQPQVPAFLRLPETTVESRFQEIVWRERLRNQQGLQNPSPTFQFSRRLVPETRILDRYKDIQPWANNRVRLPVPDGKLDYINASPITSPSPLRPSLPPFTYIAMQGPKVNTVEHTWRMVAQLKSPAVIVMLTDTHENYMEKCYPYFPRGSRGEAIEIGQTDEFGDGFRARVECVSLEERQGGAIQMRKLNLHVEGRGDSTVWHLLYRRWPDFGVPNVDDQDSFFELMKLSRDLNVNTDNPRIIHCSAGVGRTGTFIALETLMRDVNEGAMDDVDPSLNGDEDDPIFRTVNTLREQRRTMVQADSQYAFIYKVLRRQWLEKHGLLDDATDNERASKRLEVYDDPFVEHNG
ncbi:protein-tyrosine phosphatase-like protein [Xylaria arbuscula]|nr:protein-tyrosine phosphatase-like protein [Xylaria arbuscula]